MKKQEMNIRQIIWKLIKLWFKHGNSHCEILDEKKGLSANMDDEVPYPCLKCPFNSYKKK